MRKRLLSVILVLAALLPLAVPAGAADYVTTGRDDDLTLICAGFDHKAWSASTYSTPAEVAARVLYSYGLLEGSGVSETSDIDFSLTAPMTRQEAIVMLVRLLGKDQEAAAGGCTMPYTDVDAWAAPYVAYAYESGLTKGVTATTFGGKTRVDEKQYLVFALRALGYSEADGDFSWADPYTLAKKAGVLSPCIDGKNFRRGDAVLISCDALYASLKGTDARLLDKLLDEGAASRIAVVRGDDIRLDAASQAELIEKLTYCVEHFGQSPYYIYLPASMSTQAQIDAVWQAAQKVGGVPSCPELQLTNILHDDQYRDAQNAIYNKLEAQGLKYSAFDDEPLTYEYFAGETRAVMGYIPHPAYAINWGSGMEFDANYVNNISAISTYAERNILLRTPTTHYDLTLRDVLRGYENIYHLYQETVEPGMSDYETVWACYNAAARTITYDTALSNAQEKIMPLRESDPDAYEDTMDDFKWSNYSRFTWVGAINNGKTVCEGYAEFMEVLLNMAGVPCILVSGEPENGDIGHAWNKVYLEGNWYNLDATWDDKGSSAGKTYFLKSDDSFRSDDHKEYVAGEYKNLPSSRVTAEKNKPAPVDY